MQKTEEIVEEVKKCACLYDLSYAEYKNVQKENEKWEEIEKALNLPGEECKKQLKSLLDTYKKRKRAEKLASGSGPLATKRRKYMDVMSSLEPFKDSKTTLGSIKTDNTLELALDCSPSTSTSTSFADAGECISAPQVKKVHKKQAEADMSQMLTNMLQECVSTVKELTTAKNAKEKDATSQLFQSLAKRISESKLTMEQTRRIENKVVALVYTELDKFDG